MKKLTLSLLLGFIWFCANSQSGPQTVMIKSVETYGSFAAMQGNLHIIDEQGNTSTVGLQKHNTKGIPSNMTVIKSTIDRYLGRGFKLIASDAASFGWNGVFTIEHTYILEKSENDKN